MTERDLRDIADELGISVDAQSLRTANGLWVPEERRIILKRGLGAIDRRCVLTHELIHAQAGHGPHGLLRHVEEGWTRKETARTLVDPDALQELIEWHPDTPLIWCQELKINEAVLKDWLRMAA